MSNLVLPEEMAHLDTKDNRKAVDDLCAELFALVNKWNIDNLNERGRLPERLLLINAVALFVVNLEFLSNDREYRKFFTDSFLIAARDYSLRMAAMPPAVLN